MTLVERPARHASPGVPAAHPFARALPLFLFAGLCLSSLDTTAKYLVRDHSVCALGMTVIVASGLLLALQERQRARWRSS